MSSWILLGSVILIACIIGNKISSRLGVPTLFFFIALGMLFGSDGLLKIEFGDFVFSEQICSTALIFIMFYGGFGTKWSAAKPVAGKAILLSTLGVWMTAGLVGIFCHFVLGTGLLEGLLLGAVLGSTDAASVFSVLRSQRLNLKYGTASLLEVESGSNDPCAYMLTVVLLSAMGGEISAGQVVYAVFAQIVYGVLAGIAIAALAGLVLRHARFETDGFDAIFLIAVILATYAVPALVGGNGYISAYLAGILLGNQTLPRKKNLVHFFDAFNGMMQMLIFFLLGLLVFPSQLPSVFLPSLFIALFLTFVARPLSVCCLMTPFKAPFRQQCLVSWAGLRGAASIVFAIMAVVSPAYGKETIFQIVFCVVLLSILFQGTLLPMMAKKLDMLDEQENVLKTFNDYSDETNVQFIRLDLREGHPWIHRRIQEIESIPGLLIAAVLRGKEAVMPKGDTRLQEGDALILVAKEYLGREGITLSEQHVEQGSVLIGKKLKEIDLKKQSLVVLIQRDGKEMIPDGESRILEGDVLVLYTRYEKERE